MFSSPDKFYIDVFALTVWGCDVCRVDYTRWVANWWCEVSIADKPTQFISVSTILFR